MPRGGPQPGSGNPGFAKLKSLRDKIDAYAPQWWELWQTMITSDDKSERNIAFQEFNKLQMKVVPSEEIQTQYQYVIKEGDQPMDPAQESESDNQ